MLFSWAAILYTVSHLILTKTLDMGIMTPLERWEKYSSESLP